MTEKNVRVAAFATQGNESHDAARARALISDLSGELWDFDRGQRLRSGLRIFLRASEARCDLVVMEGTGIAGGFAMILARLLRGVSYVVSSGDAVGPFVGSVLPAARPIAALYERALYSLAAGVIGWSPYITGRAVALGARRAMTVPHWSMQDGSGDGAATRQRLGIAHDAIVIGVVGSLAWNRRHKYCYGQELVDAICRIDREDVVALIVGDGSGRQRLAEGAGERLNRQVFLPGAVSPGELAGYLSAMDVGVLGQSVDALGASRYTSKLSDYLQHKLPIITTQIPAAYDIGEGWTWRLPGDAPWDPRHIHALATLLATIDKEQIAVKQRRAPRGDAIGLTDPRAVGDFLRDVVERSRG